MAGRFRTRAGGLRRFSVCAVPGLLYLCGVLVLVHHWDPYKHFLPFLLAPVHVLDLYKHHLFGYVEKCGYLHIETTGFGE